MANKTQRIFWAAAILIAVVGFYIFTHSKGGGCVSSSIRGGLSASKFDVPFSRFKNAETLRKAQSDELVAEVQNVIEQNGLPADVFVDDIQSYIDDERKPPLNIAEILDELFHVYYDPEQSNDSLEKLWNASPDGTWNINEQTLNVIRPTLVLFESKRQTIRATLRQRGTRLQPGARFHYIFVYPDLRSPEARRDVGVTINTEASRYLSDYALLEEYAIAQALLDGNIAEANSALAYIFRIAYLASHLANVGARSDAALVRLRAFDVMQRVVLDPQFNRTHMVALRKMLVEQYDHWIPEHATWFGDRASGIILYHRVMLCGPEVAFEDAEYDELDKRGILDIRDTKSEFDLSFEKYYESDHAFYLRSMQKILDISEKPFVKRQNVLEQIQTELRRRERRVDNDGIVMEAFVANLLLKDVQRLMEFFAKDESALNRVLVLMDASLGQSSTHHYRDPFTDKPYEIRKVDGLLSITTPNLPRPFQVPIFTEENQEQSITE